MNKKIVISTLLILLFSFISIDLVSQCPMCKMAVESNQQNGGTSAQGLNNGILYLLSMPYVLIGALAFIWIKNRKKEGDISQEATPQLEG
ncbi:MAG: hypothetical protein P8M34_10760 [Saprospiraceae bacterium]|nr:hypothetical protein [Saprospiraceae bacterium]